MKRIALIAVTLAVAITPAASAHPAFRLSLREARQAARQWFAPFAGTFDGKFRIQSCHHISASKVACRATIAGRPIRIRVSAASTNYTIRARWG